MYFGGRKDMDDTEYKEMLNTPKEAPVPPTKPSDVRNGDLVSLLLAATPPYLYNMPMIPHSFFFSEMLRSFVQAKTERQHMKAHQVHRRRKRSWRESSPPKAPVPDLDKPLELTTQRSQEKSSSPSPPPKRTIPNAHFTAEKLASSSVSSEPVVAAAGGDASLPNPPMWFPGAYPSQPPYPIDPLHFFIDLRVSARIWDNKLAAEREGEDNNPRSADSPLNLTESSQNKLDIAQSRQNSAFIVPQGGRRPVQEYWTRSNQSVHYLIHNIKNIYKPHVPKVEEESAELVSEQERDSVKENGGEDTDEEQKQKEKDLRALIGLELVADFVKQESDVSDEETEDP